MSQASVGLPEYEAAVAELVGDLKRFRAANVTLENAVAVLDLARDELMTANRQSQELEQAAIEVLQQLHELDPSALRSDMNQALGGLHAALDSVRETQSRAIQDLVEANGSARKSATERFEELDDRLEAVENRITGLAESVDVVRAEIAETKGATVQGIEVGREARQAIGTIVPSMIDQVRMPLDNRLEEVSKRQVMLIFLGVISVVGALAILFFELR